MYRHNNLIKKQKKITLVTVVTNSYSSWSYFLDQQKINNNNTIVW